MFASLLCWALLPLAEAAAPVHRGALDPLVDELVPLVEAHAGARFDTVPEVVLADPEALAEVLYQEQLHLLGELTDLDAEASEASAQSTATQVSHLFAGKYGFLDKKLYLSPQGIAEALAQADASPAMVGPLLKVVLAHELTHALQDQQIDLARVVIDAETADGVMATNCTVEGHAVWVQEQVARELGLHEANQLMARVLGYADGGMPRDPSTFYSAYVYGLGRDFAAWHVQRGGNEHMWSLLRQPPTATAMVVDPDRYFDGPPEVTPGLPAATQRSTRRLGRRGWSLRSQRLGDFDVREQLVRSGSGPRLADDVAEAWHARSVGGEMLGVEVQVLRFASPALAQSYVLDMGRNAAFQAAAVEHDRRVVATAGVFEAVTTDASARESIALQVVGPTQHLGTVWLAQGSDVVQIITVNRTPTDRRIARAVRPLLRRLKRIEPPTASPLGAPVLLSRAH